jgi:predicted ABC-type ATPase
MGRPRNLLGQVKNVLRFSTNLLNGAGKTTFALRYLPEMTGCRNFINADLIADGLSPLNPAGVQLEAGKILLREIEANVTAETDFAFETTLSGRMYVRLLKELHSTRLRSDGTTARQEGWKIVLFYLWIPDAEFSRLRVRQRVESGGHDIPDEAIARRYRRTVSNFLTVLRLCVTRFSATIIRVLNLGLFVNSGTVNWLYSTGIGMR